MVHGMFGAFSGAGFAHLGTQSAQRFPVFVAACNGGGGQAAHVGAFHIRRDATDHRFGVILLEAGRRTLKAGGGAFITFAQASHFFFADHVVPENSRIFGKANTGGSGIE